MTTAGQQGSKQARQTTENRTAASPTWTRWKAWPKFRSTPSLSPALAVLVAAAPGALARPEAPPQSLRIGQTRHLRRSAFAPAAPALVGLLFLGADNSELRSIIHFLCLAGTNKE